MSYSILNLIHKDAVAKISTNGNIENLNQFIEFDDVVTDDGKHTKIICEPPTQENLITLPNRTITVNSSNDIFGTTLNSSIVNSNLTNFGDLSSTLNMNNNHIDNINQLYVKNTFNSFKSAIRGSPLVASDVTLTLPSVTSRLNYSDDLQGSTLPAAIQNNITRLGTMANHINMNFNNLNNVGAVNGHNNFNISAANNLIGVGTSSPQANLHIVNTSNNDSFRVDDSTSDTTYFKVTKDGNLSIKSSTSNIASCLYINNFDTNCGISISGDDSLKNLLTTKVSTILAGGIDSDYANRGAGSICVLGCNANQPGALIPYIDFARTRASHQDLANNTYTALINNDVIGHINFMYDNGTNLRNAAARIHSKLKNTVEGVLTFQTSNSSGTLEDRIVIDSNTLTTISTPLKTAQQIQNTVYITSSIYTQTNTDNIIIADTSSNAIVINLISSPNGTHLVIKCIGPNTCTINPLAGKTINGLSSNDINNGELVDIHNFNNNWY